MLALAFTFCLPNPAHGIAKQSTLTMTVSDSELSFTIMPTASGTFGSSSNNTITVTTDNFTGYSLQIATNDSTDMLNDDDDAIPTIGSSISESTFRNDSNYVNKWGYKPSQYVTTSGGVNTTVANSNYLPAPSTTGDLLAVTNTANSSSDT